MRVRKRNPHTREPVFDETGTYAYEELSAPRAFLYWVFNGIPPSHVRSAVIIGWRILVGVGALVALTSAAGSDNDYSLARSRDLKTALEQVAKQVGELTDQQKASRLETLDTKIFEMRRSYCSETNDAVKRQYAARINELVSRYRAITGNWPRVPACDET